MTENNKLYKALDQLQFTGKVNDDKLKTLEKEIFTEDNLKYIKADEGSDLYNFLSGEKKDSSKYVINDIIDNTYDLSEAGITNFLINNKVYKKDQFHSEHGFVAALLNGEAGHFCTYENGGVIFNSSIDRRQVGRCCGIHAIEGVLIAEELTKKGKNIEEFKQKHKELAKTSEDDLIEQRKILFKMEILDALILQNDKNYPSSFITTPEGITSYNTKKTQDEERERIEKSLSLEALYKLYFEEFQARCAALQAVKKELELEAQKPVRRVVVENPEDENDKTEPKKEKEVVSTSEVTEGRQECDTLSKKEPDPSRDTQNSEISTTSSILSEHPKMKQDTVYDWTKKEDTKIETYDIEDNKIKKIDNINEKAAQLYLDILMQVLKEAKEESGLEEITEEKITAIKNKTEEKIDTCFTIRDENNNIIENLTKEDKEDLELARTDYKNRAEADERVINIFNKLNELKKYQGATKEIQKQLFQQEKTTTSIKM